LDAPNRAAVPCQEQGRHILMEISIDVTSRIKVKWLKGIYLIDRTIKGFESQEKSDFRILSESTTLA
jgi:hypothetical protein